MNFYLVTIAVSIILEITAQIKGAIYKSNNVEDINYSNIGKYNVFDKKTLAIGLALIWGLNLLVLLIPVINVLLYGYTLYKAGDSRYLDKKINQRNLMLSPITLLNTYDIQCSIEDSFKIDGLSKEEIKEQMKIINQESGYAYITKKMYDDIKASQEAIDYLNEFEQNEELNLTRKDKIKLLREYRKAFVGGSKETIKPIEKTLKLTNK